MHAGKRKLWIEQLGGQQIEDRLSVTSFTSQFLCKHHFAADSFDVQGRLKAGALPMNKAKVFSVFNISNYI